MIRKWLRRGIALLILGAWPAVMLTLWVSEGTQCGWHRGLWQDVVCKSPDKARGHLMLGRAYYAHGRSDLAELEFARAVELAQRQVYGLDGEWEIIAQTNLAAIFTDRRQYREADQLLREILRKAPNYSLAWNLMALCMVAEGRPVEAIQISTFLLNNDPAMQFNASVFYHRGLALHSLGDCDRANADYKRAAALDPSVHIPACRAPSGDF